MGVRNTRFLLWRSATAEAFYGGRPRSLELNNHACVSRW
jgi:hypothetical protein